MAEHTYSDDTRDHSGRSKQYTPVEDVHDLLRRYIESLERGSDDDDDNLRNTASAGRYATDIRWYHDWLADQDLTPYSITTADAEHLGTVLADEFNGSTPRNRWKRIHACHDYVVKLGERDTNPLDAWDDDVRQEFGMTHTSAQEKHLEDDEQYAVSAEEVRQMEEHVSTEPMRDALLIRLLWQTGIRKGEAVGIKHESHIDMDAREITLPAQNTKTNQERVVAYQPSLDGLIRKWMYDGYRDRYAVAQDSPYLFVSRRSPQMSTDAVTDVVVEAAKDAGINRELYTDAQGGSRWKVTPHAIRHGYGHYMVHETDASLFEVSKAMGHASVQVTQRRYVGHEPEAGTDAMHRYGPE